MNDEKNISGLIHHLSRQLTVSANEKWRDIGYPDIRTTHVSILVRVAAQEKNHNVIARQLGISRQAVSRLNHELIDNGYLQPNDDENNKKAIILSLTEKGRQFLKDFAKANQSLENAFTGVLGEEKFVEFKAALLRLDDFFKAK